jgi:uncharacterized protein
MNFNFPFMSDSRGHTAQVDIEKHIFQMVEQLLFTEIGERVNRPSFGTPINQLVFAPNSEELATSTSHLVQGALQQWLGDLIQVTSVNVESKEMELHVTVEYIIRKNQLIQRAEFNRGLKIGTSD